ncbi:pro-kumamolisin [Aureococcus anophagefferens]|nr:pro-kumamolisin [Aureococcus anophagefferens]
MFTRVLLDGSPKNAVPGHGASRRGGLYVLDPTDWAADLGEDLDWATANAPFVRLPGHPAIERVFYYRWRVVKKHIVPIDGGSVITEFLPRVPWAGAHNTIPAAAGHHIAEAAWLADATVATNYSRWWFAGGNPASYTNWIGYATWRALAHHGDATVLVALRDKLARVYRETYVGKRVARASFPASATALGQRLWNENIASFAVLPCDAPPRRSREPTPTRLELRNAAPIVAADPCDLEAVRVPGEPVDVRELLAYAPFAFEGLVDETRDYEPMFAQLFDEAGFAAPFGLTTAERRHPCFNYSWAHGDTWNQESWPYETSRLLKGLADRLHAGRGTASLTAASYAALLTAYAEQHNVHPFLGYWNNRERMYWTNNTEKDMGVHYFHSTFNDNVLAGLLGIRLDPRAVGRAEVRPLLLDPARGPFAVDGVVLLDNRTLSATWDEAAGFAVYVDGVVRNRSDTVVPLWVDLDCMIAATLMVMMPWEAPRRSGYDACVAPEDAALEAALRRSSRCGRATRRIGAGVACVLLLAVASSAARSRDGLRTREMDVVAPEGCGGAARFDVAARFTAGSAGAMTFKDGAAVKLAYYEKGARKEACDTHTIYLPPVLRSKPRRGGARRRLDEADDVTPKTLASYYDVDTALDGAGATQSVFETDLETYSPGDLEAFEAEFDLRKSRVSDVGAHVSDEACAADADACSEANLDVQYITALAPGAETVYWYLDETVLDVFVQYAVDLDAAEDTPLVNSISYGSFERENAPDAMEAFNRAAMKLGLAGATVFVSSGDDGAPNGIDDASECGYNPSYPATSPYVVAVGATYKASWADDDAGEVVCESDVDDAVITSGGGFSESSSAASSTRSRASCSAPTVAGMTTLVNAIRLEAGASPVGFINPTLYASRGAFANDVTSGNNKCVAENEFCCDEGFAARGGWDATTGWGSVHFPAYEKVLTADLAPDAVERAKARLRARGAAKKKAAPS